MGRSSKLRARTGSVADGPAQAPPPTVTIVAGNPDPRVSPAPDLADGLKAAERGVLGRIALLKEAFERTHQPAAPDTRLSAHLSHFAQMIWAGHRRALKTIIGLIVLVSAGWVPVRALLQTTSTEAVINARLVTLRAPIEGDIEPTSASLAVGTDLQSGQTLLRIVNRRADRNRLDDIRRLIGQLEGERSGLLAKRTDLNALHADLVQQALTFQNGRTRQLEARMAELRSEIAASDANREEAEKALARATVLAEKGTTTRAGFDKARRDALVARETQAALRHRLAAIDVELAALGQGVFVGDSYNDRPRSSQRADEVAQRLSEVTADLREREERLVGLRSELETEGLRYAELASAELRAPVRGTIWEVLTSPGESVARGQDLARVLDCSGLVVTATVGEAAYNRLRVGDRTRFRFRGESIDHEGRVIGVTGVGSAPANLAIQPSALAKEPYRVTVAVPKLAASGQCDVGRTGRVTFEK